MIIVRLFGGLGNQMFQYAAGRSLAMKHNTDLILDVSEFDRHKLRKYSLFPFTIAENFVSARDRIRIVNPNRKIRTLIWGNFLKLLRIEPIILKKEPHFHFDAEFLTLPDNISLDGYWQSEKYFENIKEVIRRDFTFKNQSDLKNSDVGKEISLCESVSVHVRRGDYLSNPRTNTIHGILKPEYYWRALSLIQNRVRKPHYYYFSDDPEWVKENLIPAYPGTVIDINGPDKDYEDLKLMSLCKHHIIANSTFSWWGAWLSVNPQKIVLAPEKWFNKPDPDSRDLIPETWHKI
jgi:hypothetical protein